MDSRRDRKEARDWNSKKRYVKAKSSPNRPIRERRTESEFGEVDDMDIEY